MADVPKGPLMADMPAYDPAPARPVRLFASPFGALPTPGFNVQPDTPSSDPMASLLASHTPSRQDIAQSLGAPVDALGWMLHNMGLPVPGGMGGADQNWLTRGVNGTNTWQPGAGVPFSSQYWQNAFDNPPSLDAVLRAMRRPGFF